MKSGTHHTKAPPFWKSRFRHSKAQISTTVKQADDQPEVTKKQPRVFDATTGNTTMLNPLDSVDLAEEETMNPLEKDPGAVAPPAGGTVVFENPMIDPDDLAEPEPEASQNQQQQPAGGANITPADQTNATLHMDSSHHHAEFDEFISTHTDTDAVVFNT